MGIPEFKAWLEARSSDAAVKAFTRNYGTFGEVERRTFTHRTGEIRSAGAQNTGTNDGTIQVVGYASVFDKPSVEMASKFGVFTEYIEPGAFDEVLRSNPDVLLTWDHDTRYVLGRTANKTLDLSVDAEGLRYWSRVAPTSYAQDLKVLMDGGYLDQSSFLFRIAPGGEEWTVKEDGDGNEIVERRITRVSDLFDVCVCAAGAYPDTTSGIARTIAKEYAELAGFITPPRQVARKHKPTRGEQRAIGDVAWGPEEGFEDLACDLETLLNATSYYCLYSVVDVAVTLDKAIVIDWDDCSYWVVPFTKQGDEPELGEPSEWVQVESAWVTTAEGYEANERSARTRREARMAENSETETPAETPAPAEAEVETPAEEAPAAPEETETPAEETPAEETEETAAVEAETETEEAAPTEETSEEPAADAEEERSKQLLLAEARARIARLSSL